MNHFFCDVLGIKFSCLLYNSFLFQINSKTCSLDTYIKNWSRSRKVRGAQQWMSWKQFIFLSIRVFFSFFFFTFFEKDVMSTTVNYFLSYPIWNHNEHLFHATSHESKIIRNQNYKIMKISFEICLALYNNVPICIILKCFRSMRQKSRIQLTWFLQNLLFICFRLHFYCLQK